MPSEPHLNDGFEDPGVWTGTVLLAAAGCALMLVLSIGVFTLVYRGLDLSPRSRPERVPVSVQAGDSAERDALLAKQRARISGYRWVARDKGIIAIPIEKAMALIAVRGAHAYDPMEPPQSVSGGKP